MDTNLEEETKREEEKNGEQKICRSTEDGVVEMLDDNECNRKDEVTTNGNHEQQHEVNGDGDKDEDDAKSSSITTTTTTNIDQFTYTSLTSFDNLNNTPQDTSANTNNTEQPQQQQQQQSNELNLANANETTTQKSQSYDRSSSLDNIQSNEEKIQLEKIIEKLKTNQITNKEVVNYILNLLVGGEFDLEKNFIIKNMNNIFYMLQVIKCASEALKAEIWSLFTAILRKSQRNLQACVEIGLIEAALHELEDADPICADLIVEMLTVLASYSITVDELKAIFYSLKCEDKQWVIIKAHLNNSIYF